MTTSQTQTQTTMATASAAQEPETAPKIKRAPPKPRTAPVKAKSAKKAPPKKRRRKAKPVRPTAGSRKGSKTAKVLELLKRPQGAILPELMKATACRVARTVRRFYK
jgi:hypothetical protein